MFHYSVVTSVSVILNGDEPQFTDALGQKVPKPQPSLQVASPIDLLNPDRYEFYTFDDNGELVKRLMTMQEIQSIVANGDGEGPNIIHTAPIDERDPEKNVQDIVYSVQNVLNKQVENSQNSTNNDDLLPVLDTPDVSSSWSMILPAIFGNTGGDIYPQHKPQQIVMTPDSELVDVSTKQPPTLHSTKKPKPNKRKPGQKRKTTTTAPKTTSTTTEILPQVVQEELDPHESVYTGIQQYQNIASNVQDFETFSLIHMQPIFHKLPESTSQHAYINNQEVIQPQHVATVKKPELAGNKNKTTSMQQDENNEGTLKNPTPTHQQQQQQHKHTGPHRKNGTKRPRPTSTHNQQKVQKKPTTTTPHKRTKPTKIPTTTTKIPTTTDAIVTTTTTLAPTTTTTTTTTATPSPTTITTEQTTTTTTTTATSTTTPTPEPIASTTTAATTTVPKKKKKKPTRHPTTTTTVSSDTPTHLKPNHHASEKRKPIQNNNKHKVETVDAIAEGSEQQKTPHRHRPKPQKYTTTPIPIYNPTPTPTTSVISSTQSSLVIESFPGLNSTPEGTRVVQTTSGYPVPAYGMQQHPYAERDEITINQLKRQPDLPSLSLLQQQYHQAVATAVDELSADTHTEDDLKLSFGQIVQSLKQEATKPTTTTTIEESVKPLGYDSAESIDKLEEIVNKRKRPYISAVESDFKRNDTIEIPAETNESITVVTTEKEDATTLVNQASEIANIIKFEPLAADIQEPIVKDLTTTEFDTETITTPTSSSTNYNFEETTADSSDISLLYESDESSTNSIESLPVTVSQQVDMLLGNSNEDITTTIPPPIVADLNAQLNLDMLKPTDAISMSKFQLQAATVASHLIDSLKPSSTSSSLSSTSPISSTEDSESKDELEQLMSDVIQQINDQNADEAHNRLTHFAHLNTSFILKSPIEHTQQPSLTQLVNDVIDLTTEIPNEQLDDEASEESTTIIPSNNDLINDSTKDITQHIITLATEYTPTTEGSGAISHSNEYSDEISTEQQLDNMEENETATTTNSNIKEITLSAVPTENPLETETVTEIETEMEEILETTIQPPTEEDVKALKANNGNKNNNSTTIKYAMEQLLDTATNNKDIPDEGQRTEAPKATFEDIGSTEIKVNDAGTQKEIVEIKQQQQQQQLPLKIAAKIEDNFTGEAGVQIQYEKFVTETSSIEHEKQSTSKLDIANPINSTSQNTENAEIPSAINYNSQETMSLNIESGTDIPMGTTDDITSLSTDSIESTTLTFEPADKTEEVSTEISSTEADDEITIMSTESSRDEDPYVKLGETTTTTTITTPTSIDVEKNQTLVFSDSTINSNKNEQSSDEEDEEDQTTTTIPITKTITSTPSTTSTTTTTPTTTTTTTTTTSTTIKMKPTPTKRMNTLKPVSYYKQPTFATYNQPEYPKPITYVSPQQRPMQRPPALSNLMASSLQATRPPVKLEPSPTYSKGLEASTLDLDPDVLQFARLCNELAFNYWRSITSEKISSARSLVISPFALTSMLSMVFLGARGSTSGEMNEVLKLDDMVTFNPHLIFKNITDSVERATDSDIATTAFVREIFSDRANGKILQFFKEKTQQFYAGHVEEVNFNVVNDIIRRRTNLLVKRHTMGKVSEYLRTNSVWVNGPLATISANLFQTDCSRGSISDRDGELFFQVHPSVRQRRLVPIPAVLYKTGFTAGYDQKLDATIVAFGRIQDTVSTIYVMPGHQTSTTLTDNLDRLEKDLVELAFSENAWSNLLTSLMDRPGLEVQLPRFSHRSFVNASLGLQKMGLKGLFKSDFADLRGLTGSSSRDIFLSDMIQINTFSTCGEERIADHHHVEMYPAPPLRKRNKDVESSLDDDTLDSSEAIIDFGSLVQDSALARSFYDDLLDPKYLELPLPLRPRQARVPDTPPRLRFDKPFLYFVRHNPTGIILFMGRFNPRLLP